MQEPPPLGFFGGSAGALAPFVVFITGVTWLGLSGAPDERGLWPVLIASILVALLLARDRDRYCNTLLRGMSQPIVMLMLMAWMLAGILGALLTGGGLVGTLAGAAQASGLHGGGYAAAAFLVCCLFSASTGTSLGTLILCLPVLYPAGAALGADPVILAGAIIGGATFGDNISPVSDTTIASATTQGAPIGEVVRSRLRYALPAAGIALLGYTVLGGGDSLPIASETTGSTAPLVLLVAPALVFVMLLRRHHLVEGLLAGIAATFAVGWIGGLIQLSDVLRIEPGAFAAGGLVVEGIERALGISIFTLLLMGLVAGIEASGLLDRLVRTTSRSVRSERGAEAWIFAAVSGAVMLTTHSVVAILAVGRVARQTGEQLGVGPIRRANLLDTTVCTYPFLLPWFIPTILGRLADGFRLSNRDAPTGRHAGRHGQSALVVAPVDRADRGLRRVRPQERLSLGARSCQSGAVFNHRRAASLLSAAGLTTSAFLGSLGAASAWRPRVGDERPRPRRCASSPSRTRPSSSQENPMQPDRHITGVSFAILLLVAVITQPTAAALAQGSRRDLQEDATNVTVDPLLFEGLEYRSSGFARGGRSTAVTGVAGDPLTYYFGSTGGGVWKTSDAGNNWNNISDGFFGVGAIGAIAVAPSDPNVLYAGTGSGCPRGNISNGDGIYRSTDAGRTWSHIGLDHAGQIPKIRVHPDNPDVVYVAALGHIFGPNEDRGVFRSTDGGDTWDKVLYIDDATGFNQVAMDVNNPRILYAAAWRVERKPWTLISGNDNGGIWKSTDGGDTWTQLAGGLPTGLVGKIDVTVSAANSDRLWALIEAEGERGGVYRSDDAGDSWSRINSAANLRQRPWYYTHIYADPKDENTVYALNTGLYRSIDGGVGFDQQIDVPHGDNHDLWINPGSPQIMINANDGGANVSFNGGESWSSQMNQPTAEIYRVFVDDDWPYRIYGPQQDNSTISIPSFTGRNRVFPDWFAVGGCESGHIAIDPRDNSVVYAGCYGGAISRLDRDAGSSRQVLTYPQLQLGQAPRDLEYRFQWNAPIRISPHDPDVVYHTSQVVHRTGDGGQSWEVISPDLTTDNPETQDYAGGPISHDSTGVEVYNTIFAFEESPHTAGLLWAGSDDGKIHLSRNNGGSWTDITPDDMPPGGTVNVIDLSAHDPGRAHVAVYRYREGDFGPYIFQTSDYGDSWRLLTAGDNGIPATNFVRAVREDPEQQGLLFAGTEYGMYASFDDGSHWQELQLNLPVTPVTDLRVHRGDLVVSTQGRGFWVLDDMTMLRQADEAMAVSGSYLFAPRKAYRVGNFGPTRIRYYLAEETESEETDGEVTLTILDADGEILEEVTGSPGEDDAQQSGAGGFFAPLGSGPATLTAEPGLNTFTWRLREEAPDVPDDVTLWGIAPGRPVLPGTYTVQLSRGDWSQEQQIVVGINPKPGVTAEDLRLQHEFLGEVGDAIGEMYDGLRRLRDIKKQGAEVVAQMDRAGIDNEEITAAQKAMAEKLTAIEEQITQVKSRSSQDPLNFPPMLDNQIINVYGYALGGFGGGDNRPTDGAHERFEDLKPQLASLMSQLQEIVDTDLDAFNAMVESADVPAVVVSQ